jgi:hypothetical protein
MPTDHGNEQRLRDAGLIVADKLPPAFVAVLEELTPDEVEVLAGLTPDEAAVILDVKRRLDEAGRMSGDEPGTVGILP